LYRLTTSRQRSPLKVVDRFRQKQCICPAAEESVVGLISQLLSKDPKLQACSTSDPAHIFEGAAGDHVSRIQTGLQVLGCRAIDERELAAKRYGPEKLRAGRS
jgi:hypothetical protein